MIKDVGTGNGNKALQRQNTSRVPSKQLYTLSTSSEEYHLPSAPQAQNFLSAIFQTGTMLGLKCGSSFPSKSQPQGPHIPASLQPTFLQLTTVHYQWIDRLPWPEVRDEIIIQSGTFEEEDLLFDIFNMEAFTLRPGAHVCDPTAYEIGKEFGDKWGYLFPRFSSSANGSDGNISDSRSL